MQYTSIDQWKAKIRQLAKQNNVDVQDMQQRYILEEFARKISASRYRDSIILKGGFVVSALLGIDERKTRDIDFTFNSTIYDEEQVRSIIGEIITTNIQSFFDYELISIKEEQVDDHYTGYSCLIDAVYNKTRLHLKLDISNNTLVYPRGIETKVHSFIDEDILLMTYPLENIIAEKYETTMDRGEFNTRMRDLYDVHMLFVENHHLIDEELLAKTIVEVSIDRKTTKNLFMLDELLDELVSSEVFTDEFKRFMKNNYVYKEYELSDVVEAFKSINLLVQNSGLLDDLSFERDEGYSI
ncbi:MAG: nucleotidyl transferase AbiEii/AbiGii toxin family protein [Coprobacillus sp.]|nr:nucleotidyl transferase AbiEii/AbiGii toxin family protein [Coprobacillus sp.]